MSLYFLCAYTLQGFAQKIFDNADAADRAGRSDDKTAKALYASSIFFDVARQFGALAPELAAKQKYAAWRAGHIRTALKQGRQPAPAGGVSDERDGADVAARDELDGDLASAAAAPAPLAELRAAPPAAEAGGTGPVLESELCAISPSHGVVSCRGAAVGKPSIDRAPIRLGPAVAATRSALALAWIAPR